MLDLTAFCAEHLGQENGEIVFEVQISKNKRGCLKEPSYEKDANLILGSVLKRRLLSGAVVGILDGGHQEFFLVGKGLPVDGLFEIGSLSKIYTGFLLAVLIEQKRIGLEDSLCHHLPSWVCPSPVANPIRIFDLATHTSGLPLLPDDVGRMRRRIDDPYDGYTFDDLYRYLARTSLERPASPSYFYSNLGYAVLAQAMANATGIPFPKLVLQEVFEPLKLHDTFVEEPLAPGIERLLPGHTALGRPAIPWLSPVFAGCGAVASTAADCLRFLELCISPPPEWRAVVENSLKPIFAPEGKVEESHLSLAWKINDTSGWNWHNGVTGGHSAYLSFHPERRQGIVVLTDRYAIDLTTDFARRMQRVLEGYPAELLTGSYNLPRSIATQAVIEFVNLPFWVRSGATAAIAGGVLEALLRWLPR
jgi:CubicO group peptidase (beta-lactamase class C family)